MSHIPQVGDKLGRYILHEELGRGGMAVVFRAQDPVLTREVAIKIMHPHLWGNTEYARRFVREARAVAALHHPNIVEIFDFGGGPTDEVSQKPLPGYIVSELIRGPTLHNFLDRYGVLLPEVAAMIIFKLAVALQVAHRQGIIHRDIKPENVMIAEGGRVILTDFGIARIAEGEVVTQTGAMIGSPAYMSPEQARGGKIDPRSDLFSLGAVLYQLTTGRLPFPGKDPISTALRVLEGKYEPPLKMNPKIGAFLDRVIKRLLQGDPEQRFSSAEALATQLGELLEESGLSEIDKELEAYFVSPGDYNRDIISRLLVLLLQQARQAMERRDYPKALLYCDRLLAFEPAHPEALSLLRKLSNRRKWHLPLWLTLVGMLLGSALGGYYLFSAPRSRSMLSGQRRTPQLAAVERRAAAARRQDTALQKPSPAHPVALKSRDAGPAWDAKAIFPSAAQRRGLVAAEKLVRAARFKRRPRQGEPPASEASSVHLPPDAGILPRPDPGTLPPAPPARPATGPGKLLVTIGPWCDVILDGKKVGTSPMQQPISVDPGVHNVRCEQGRTGAAKQQTVQIVAGEHKELSGLIIARVQVRLKLKRGDGITIDGHVYRGTFSIPPKRYRIDLVKDGNVLAGQWLTIPSQGCTLVDEPELSCRIVKQEKR